MKILVIGVSCRDVFNYGSCIRLCPEAPVPVFNPVEVIDNGGMAKNVYRNVMSLGAKANLVTNKNWQSITKTRFIDKKTNHMFMRLDCNDGDYGRAELEKVKFDNYDAVILSDYNKGFMTEDDIAYVAKNHPLTFLDTKKILGEWCKDITFIKINDNEFEKTKHMVGPEIESKMIMTMGSEGCRYAGVTYSVPRVEIKDPSGAGDTFVASLAYKYVESGHNMEKAIEFANKCATEVVQRRGVSTV
jgi:bifunctional ADP-heptose synthase (sugar kinase/adenylyltransferase)